MNRRAAACALLLVGCRKDLEPWEWGQGATYVPLADLLRPGCAALTADDATANGTDLGAFDKPRPVAWRGTFAAFGAYTTYRPSEPDGDTPATVNPSVWAFWGADADTAALQRTVDGAPGPAGPMGSGTLGLVCNGASGNYLVTYDAVGPTPIHEATEWYGTAPSSFGGSCDGTTSIGPDGASLGIVVDWTAGTALQVTPGAGGPTAAELVVPLPDLVPTDVAWVERLADGRVGAVTVASDGQGGADLAWRTVDDDVAATVDGDPLPGAVWRGADGDLRVATTYGVYRWVPGSPVELVEVIPSVPVDAAWSPTAGAGAMVAVAVEPNEAEPSLDVPVAAAVAVAHDGGWAVQEVPVTPCVDGATCRYYGEARVAAVVGPATDPIVLYDLWRWDADEAHDAVACPR